MGPTSRYGCSPGRGWLWQVLLLLTAFVSSPSLQFTGRQAGQEIPIALDPPSPVAGENITLIPGGYVTDIGICFWLRGGVQEKHRIFTYFPAPNFFREDGPAYTGRETVGTNCSMHIRELKAADTGNYTVLKSKLQVPADPEKGRVYLFVPEYNPSPTPAAKRTRGLSTSTIAGIIVICLIGAVLVAALISYQALRETASFAPAESGSRHSGSTKVKGEELMKDWTLYQKKGEKQPGRSLCLLAGIPSELKSPMDFIPLTPRTRSASCTKTPVSTILSTHPEPQVQREEKRPIVYQRMK